MSRQIGNYLAGLSRQIGNHLAGLSCQIAFPFKECSEYSFFCCFITQLVKKLQQWFLYEVIEDIMQKKYERIFKKGAYIWLKNGDKFINVFQSFEKTVDMVLLDTNFDNIFL